VTRKLDLVSAGTAARMLGVPHTFITKLRRKGRMPKGIPIEGTADAYRRADVLKLAGELEAERAERQERVG
jgi:hypothetical protein